MITDLNTSTRGLTSADIDTLFGTRNTQQTDTDSVAASSSPSSSSQVATYGSAYRASSATGSAALLAHANIAATFDSPVRLTALPSSSSIDATFSYATTTTASDGTSSGSLLTITAHQDPDWQSFYTYDFATTGGEADPEHRAMRSFDYQQWSLNFAAIVDPAEGLAAASVETTDVDMPVASWMSRSDTAAYSSERLTTDLYRQGVDSLAFATSDGDDRVSSTSIAAGLANGSLVVQRADEIQGLDYQATEQVAFGHGAPSRVGGDAVMIHMSQSWNDDYAKMPSVDGHKNHAISSVDGVPVLLSWND